MIIAEVGINWNGDLNLAKRMIEEANDAGAGLAKFQLYDAEDDAGLAHYEFSRACELTFDQAALLFDYGVDVGIEVFFSVFAERYVNWCERIGVQRYKVACGMRKPIVLDALALTGKPIIMSGQERGIWANTMLYCVPEYPTLLERLHMPSFGGHWDGFSDHTIGIKAAKVALARGATIVEKHFTLDKDMAGPDQAMSMTPRELRELVAWEKVCKTVTG